MNNICLLYFLSLFYVWHNTVAQHGSHSKKSAQSGIGKKKVSIQQKKYKQIKIKKDNRWSIVEHQQNMNMNNKLKFGKGINEKCKGVKVGMKDEHWALALNSKVMKKSKSKKTDNQHQHNGT